MKLENIRFINYTSIRGGAGKICSSRDSRKSENVEHLFLELHVEEKRPELL